MAREVAGASHAAALRSRYLTRADYLERVGEAAAAAESAGFILAADVPGITGIAAINSPSWERL